MSNLLAKLLTRSFPGNRDDVSTPAVIEQETPTDSHASQGFQIWQSQIEARDAARILDFGGLNTRNLGFFVERGIDLGIVNMTVDDITDQLDRFDDQGPYQGALCWDFLNYLDEGEFAETGRWLASVLTSGAPVFLALRTQHPYPEKPGRYEIIDASQLRYHPSDAPATRDVIYASGRLSKLWSEFIVDRSFLLRNGMQEFVVKRRG